MFRTGIPIRSALGFSGLLVIGWCIAAGASPQEKQHGIVVSATDNKLVIRNQADGKEQTHLVPPSAKIVLDGHEVKLEDLQKGDVVTIEVAAGGKVTGVSANRSDKVHEGLVVSTTEAKLVMTDKEGKNEHSHEVGPKARITLNGKAAKLTELKKGDAVKVAISKMGEVAAIDATRKAKA